MDFKKIKRLFLDRLKKKKSKKRKISDIETNSVVLEDISCSGAVLNEPKILPIEEGQKKFRSSEEDYKPDISLDDGFDLETKNSDKTCDGILISDCLKSTEENFEVVSDASDNSDSNFESSEEEEESDKDDNEDEKEETIEHKLRQWVTDSGITHAHVNTLLKILKNIVPELPVTTKTLFKELDEFQFVIETLPSPTDSTASAEFVYFGLTDYLQKIVFIKNHKFFKLLLQFFIDGLPLFKSSNVQFWPLLAKIRDSEVLYEPFIVACYCGTSKPFSAAHYFDQFITELNYLLAHGVIIDDQKFEVAVDCFICDRPARAFAKQIIGHQGFWACERCTVEGITYERRRIYPSIYDELRTDKSFRDFTNLHHHIGFSPLCRITPKLNMIKKFPLDVLHLAFLGILKKLMTEKWLTGELKLSKELLEVLNQRLQHLASQIPSDFQRSTRSLQLINLWKGTEYRMFCLYFGFLVTQDILPKEMQENFLQFCIALRILHDPRLIKTHLQQARELLKNFVSKFGELYGLESLVLNLHSLVHLPDDVENFNCSLSDLSAFLFESYLKKVKKNIRHGYKPLHQLCKRVAEKKSLMKKVSKSAKFIIKQTKSGNIKEIKCLMFSLKPKEPNNIVQLNDNSFFKVKKIIKNGKTICLEGSQIKLIQPASHFPSSKIFQDLHIFQIDANYSTGVKEININSVQRKAAVFRIFEGNSFIMPLLH